MITPIGFSGRIPAIFTGDLGVNTEKQMTNVPWFLNAEQMKR